MEPVALADGAVRPEVAKRPSAVNIVAAVTEVFAAGAAVVAVEGAASPSGAPLSGTTRVVPSILRTVVPPVRSGTPVAVAGAVTLDAFCEADEAAVAEVAGAATGVESVAGATRGDAKRPHGAVGARAVLRMVTRLRVGATRTDGVDPAAYLPRLVAGVDEPCQARVGTVMAPAVALGVVGPDFWPSLGLGLYCRPAPMVVRSFLLFTRGMTRHLGGGYGPLGTTSAPTRLASARPHRATGASSAFCTGC